MGKYESNSTALALALSYSDQALEACQALISLLDSEIGVLLANCRAAGIGGFGTCVCTRLCRSLPIAGSFLLTFVSQFFMMVCVFLV